MDHDELSSAEVTIGAPPRGKAGCTTTMTLFLAWIGDVA